ncbi:MAG: FAD-dependent oxidoreductase [Gammaproteobacteria bacterium]
MLGNTLHLEFDIAIIGAGPAGAVAAVSLARFGYRVALAGQPRRFPAVEGVADRALAGLRYAGCERTLRQASIRARRSAEWNGVRFAGNEETLVERASFDSALQTDAHDAGVSLFSGRVATPIKHSDGWAVTAGAHRALSARFLIDARGRAAPAKALHRGPLTIALSQVWRLATPRVPGTAIAAFPDGWAWFANATPATALLQILVSAEQTALPPRAYLAGFYQSLLAAIPAAQNWIAAAEAVGPVRARQAQPQCHTDPIGIDDARVGDAAFAIDPLSGHGIYEAIGGALALAAVVRTMLARPADAELAQRFYRERIADDFRRMSRMGRDFYRQETRWAERPFWRERGAWPDTEPAHAAPAESAPRIERRPVNVHDRAEGAEVIISADHPRGVWQVAGVALAPLLGELRTRQGEHPAEIACVHAMRQGMSAENGQAALAWLAIRGMVQAATVNSAAPKSASASPNHKSTTTTDK